MSEGRPLLHFDNVSFSYHHSQKVLENIRFSMNKGEKVALLGLNGAGKSTLILHVNGLLQPQEGTVSVDGINTKTGNIRKIRQQVGLVFQNPDDQLFMPTVEDDVAFGPRNMNLKDEEVRERVDKALQLTGTTELRGRSPMELSGGQKRMVSIATVLSMSPDLLVLDEPGAGLDYESMKNLTDILSGLPQALLMSTHDIALARTVCNRAIVIDKGKIVSDTDISSLIYPPQS